MLYNKTLKYLFTAIVFINTSAFAANSLPTASCTSTGKSGAAFGQCMEDHATAMQCDPHKCADLRSTIEPELQPAGALSPHLLCIAQQYSGKCKTTITPQLEQFCEDDVATWEKQGYQCPQ